MELSRDFHAVMCLRHTGEKQHTDVPDHPGLRVQGISTRGGAPGNLVFQGAHFGKHVSGTFQKGSQLSEHDSRLPVEIRRNILHSAQCPVQQALPRRTERGRVVRSRGWGRHQEGYGLNTGKKGRKEKAGRERLQSLGEKTGEGPGRGGKLGRGWR